MRLDLIIAENNLFEIAPVVAVYSFLMFVLFVSGLMILLKWLARSKFGSKSLSGFCRKEHYMGVYVPLVVFGVWIISNIIFGKLVYGIAGGGDSFGENILLNNFSAIAGGVVTVVGCVVVGKQFFVGGIKGFGLDFRTIFRDMGFGFINLAGVWPCIFVVNYIVVFVGKLFAGEGFEMPNHDIIQLISQEHSVLAWVSAVLVAAVVAPVMEELLFRGVFQNYLATNFQSPWVAIVLTSIFFAAVHGEKLFLHWPVLFVLSCCLGYSYFKSGSLLRNIAVHAFFNSLSLLSAFIAEYYGAGIN